MLIPSYPETSFDVAGFEYYYCTNVGLLEKVSRTDLPQLDTRLDMSNGSPFFVVSKDEIQDQQVKEVYDDDVLIMSNSTLINTSLYDSNHSFITSDHVFDTNQSLNHDDSNIHLSSGAFIQRSQHRSSIFDALCSSEKLVKPMKDLLSVGANDVDKILSVRENAVDDDIQPSTCENAVSQILRVSVNKTGTNKRDTVRYMVSSIVDTTRLTQPSFLQTGTKQALITASSQSQLERVGICVQNITGVAPQAQPCGPIKLSAFSSNGEPPFRLLPISITRPIHKYQCSQPSNLIEFRLPNCSNYQLGTPLINSNFLPIVIEPRLTSNETKAQTVFIPALKPVIKSVETEICASSIHSNVAKPVVTVQKTGTTQSNVVLSENDSLSRTPYSRLFPPYTIRYTDKNGKSVSEFTPRSQVFELPASFTSAETVANENSSVGFVNCNGSEFIQQGNILGCSTKVRRGEESEKINDFVKITAENSYHGDDRDFQNSLHDDTVHDLMGVIDSEIDCEVNDTHEDHSYAKRVCLSDSVRAKFQSPANIVDITERVQKTKRPLEVDSKTFNSNDQKRKKSVEVGTIISTSHGREKQNDTFQNDVTNFEKPAVAVLSNMESVVAQEKQRQSVQNEEKQGAEEKKYLLKCRELLESVVSQAKHQKFVQNEGKQGAEEKKYLLKCRELLESVVSQEKHPKSVQNEEKQSAEEKEYVLKRRELLESMITTAEPIEISPLQNIEDITDEKTMTLNANNRCIKDLEDFFDRRSNSSSPPLIFKEDQSCVGNSHHRLNFLSSNSMPKLLLPATILRSKSKFPLPQLIAGQSHAPVENSINQLNLSSQHHMPNLSSQAICHLKRLNYALPHLETASPECHRSDSSFCTPMPFDPPQRFMPKLSSSWNNDEIFISAVQNEPQRQNLCGETTPLESTVKKRPCLPRLCPPLPESCRDKEIKISTDSFSYTFDPIPQSQSVSKNSHSQQPQKMLRLSRVDSIAKKAKKIQNTEQHGSFITRVSPKNNWSASEDFLANPHSIYSITDGVSVHDPVKLSLDSTELHYEPVRTPKSLAISRLKEKLQKQQEELELLLCRKSS